MVQLFPPTLADEIACVQREVRMRERGYPPLVGNGSMKQATADRELETMRAVLNRLLAIVPEGEDAPADPAREGGE